MMFLMRLPSSDSNVVATVRAAAEWFKRTEIRDKTYRRTDDGRRLVDAPGSGPIWSRYYELDSNRLIFGGRDKSFRDTENEISRERRDGYARFIDSPETALESFADWNKEQR
jgi:PelA/Pel-15E family pectate lyase